MIKISEKHAYNFYLKPVRQKTPGTLNDWKSLCLLMFSTDMKWKVNIDSVAKSAAKKLVQYAVLENFLVGIYIHSAQ